MNLKEDFLSALKTGASYQSLLDIVHKYHEQGMKSEESYEMLEQIWMEFGFDDSDEESELRNKLEAVMERIWYQGKHIV